MSAPPFGNTPSREKARHENWVEEIASFARVVPGGLVHRRDNVTIVRSGLPITATNCVFALDLPGNLNGVQEDVLRILAHRGTPWCLVTTDESTRAFEPLLRALRLEDCAVLHGMVWESLPESPPSLPPGLEIRHLEKPDDVRAFARTTLEGFGAPTGLMDPWAEGIIAAGLSPSVSQAYYLGVSEGRPACTAMRVTTSDLAGIYNVSTIPEFRRRGWGTAMTVRAAVDGRREGCRESYLQSSEIGRSVYERIGYRWVEEYHVWAPGAAPST